MMLTGTNALAAITLLGLTLVAPFTVATAADPDSTSAQAVKHKKPISGVASGRAAVNNSSADSQTKGKSSRRYAKTGICSGCNPLPLPYDPGKVKPTRPAEKPRQAKATLPKDWPSPQNCKFVRQDDHDSAGRSLWEAEKTACNHAGYPTPWSDKENSASPAAAPTDDRSLGEKIRDKVDIPGRIQSEYDRAHGIQRTPCPADSTLAQDAASGCQE